MRIQPIAAVKFRRSERPLLAKAAVKHDQNEDYLLTIARHGTAHHVETLVQGYRRAVRLTDEEPQDKQHERRWLSYRWDYDGSLVLKGRLPGEVGALLVKARDKQCRFPGCTHKYFIDGHHIKHSADGGETSLDNLVQLCRYRHRLVHEGGFGCEKDGTGNVVFRNEFGDLIPENGCRRPLSPVRAVRNLKNKLEDRVIHSKTCVTRWNGEPMDRHLAVGLLCDLDHRSPEKLPR